MCQLSRQECINFCKLDRKCRIIPPNLVRKMDIMWRDTQGRVTNYKASQKQKIHADAVCCTSSFSSTGYDLQVEIMPSLSPKRTRHVTIGLFTATSIWRPTHYKKMVLLLWWAVNGKSKESWIRCVLPAKMISNSHLKAMVSKVLQIVALDQRNGICCWPLSNHRQCCSGASLPSLVLSSFGQSGLPKYQQTLMP